MSCLSIQRQAVGSTALQIGSFKVTQREVLIQLPLDSEASLVILVYFISFVFFVSSFVLFCFRHGRWAFVHLQVPHLTLSGLDSDVPSCQMLQRTFSECRVVEIVILMLPKLGVEDLQKLCKVGKGKTGAKNWFGKDSWVRNHLSWQ